ncbi:ABC transporter ATP-binding protein [Paenibacillus sp. GbtcB18]|uniref:ABC transporter ATP-binding protein n=1 Tax=Paenibacillus sp. GbtcB18 TaxID=2824763 RepID=UPI001C309543|nr:ABC transporter ATP-binding protein [Paenibacillus sp. GbtcB18]
MKEVVVEVNGLTKTYNEVKAVDGISFSIEPDKIYGLLGRNGAGKTTVMQMVTAQMFPTSGEVKVFGQPPYENYDVMKQICFIKESQKYPDNFRVADVLKVAAAIFPNWDGDYAEALIRDFGLPLKRNLKKLSRGMLSSVGVVVGLASRSPLTIFDEPYLGLDAVARSLFYDRLIEDYTRYPRTIILSTHLIDEVSRLLEHVIVIDSGKLILDAETEELRGMAYTVVGPAAGVESFVKGKEVIHREPFGSMLSVTIMGDSESRAKLLAADMGLEIAPVSLQQLIIYLTKTNLNEKAVKGL